MTIALIAHDERKNDLLEWAQYNKEMLSRHILFATGTTFPIACNRSTADYLFASPLMDIPYERQVYDYAARLKRDQVAASVHGADRHAG